MYEGPVQTAEVSSRGLGVVDVGALESPVFTLTLRNTRYRVAADVGEVLVSGGAGASDLGARVEPGRRQGERDFLGAHVLPVPPVNAGERRRVGAVSLFAVLCVETLGVAGRRAVWRGVEVVGHRAGRVPGEHHAAALIEPVEVLHPLGRVQLELGAVDPVLAGLGGERLGLSQCQQPEQSAGAQRVDAVLGRQDGAEQEPEASARGLGVLDVGALESPIFYRQAAVIGQRRLLFSRAVGRHGKWGGHDFR